MPATLLLLVSFFCLSLFRCNRRNGLFTFIVFNPERCGLNVCTHRMYKTLLAQTFDISHAYMFRTCSHVNIRQRPQYHSNEMEIITNVKNCEQPRDFFIVYIYMYTEVHKWIGSARYRHSYTRFMTSVARTWYKWKQKSSLFSSFFFFCVSAIVSTSKDFCFDGQMDGKTLKRSTVSFSFFWSNFCLFFVLFFLCVFVFGEIRFSICVIISSSRATV